MSERPLPDDLAQWPDDPRALFGVPHDAGPRELRRAYNRLIRVYKPEQFPQEFRRIRAAYESLLPIAQWYGRPAETPEPVYNAEPEPRPDAAGSETGNGPAVKDTAPDKAEEKTPEITHDTAAFRRDPEEELVALWESAAAGRPSEAYNRLVQLNQQYSGKTEVYLRLYWLLALFPGLDRHRTPADWLVQGLQATGLAGPLRELYHDHIVNDPAEALGERFERLLDCPLAAGTLADVAEWRLHAAVRLGRWKALADDLRKLRPRFGPGEDQAWLTLIFGLVDKLAWSEDVGAYDVLQTCRDEVARHEHLAPALPYAFDRFDLLTRASAGWRELRASRHVPECLPRLIAAAWINPFSKVRSFLTQVLDAIAATPQRWLDHLDQAFECAPSTLALLGDLFDQFEQAREVPPMRSRNPEVVSGLVLAFLSRLKAPYYALQRPSILGFCLREAIAPEEMGQVVGNLSGASKKAGEALSQALTADWPLRYVCRACRLFWA